MKKLDYFKFAIRNRCYRKKAWVISAFSLVKEAPDAYLKNPYIGRLIQDPTGYKFCTGEPDRPLEVIEDAVGGQPLFGFKDKVTVDQDYEINTNRPLETCVGNILVNAAVLYDVFGQRFPFVVGRMSVDNLEETIAPKLRDTPPENEERDPAFFYADEYVKFVDHLQFISGFSHLCVYAATEKIMISPPGLKAFKEQLNKKYEGQLNDPVKLSQYEKELTEYDEQFIKDDPTNGIVMSGKVKSNSRRKMFLSMGSEAGFTDSLESLPVINSLEDGWPTDPKLFAAMMNGSRSGSYSRGAETQKGGVSAKILLRATSNYVILDNDCGTPLGISRQFEKNNLNQLVGRTIKTNGGWRLVENITDAANFVGKPLIVRSPAYCHSEGDTICKVCAGMKLFENPNGLSTPITEVSAIILATAMKAMHGKVLSTARLNIQTAFS